MIRPGGLKRTEISEFCIKFRILQICAKVKECSRLKKEAGRPLRKGAPLVAVVGLGKNSYETATAETIVIITASCVKISKRLSLSLYFAILFSPLSGFPATLD